MRRLSCSCYAPCTTQQTECGFGEGGEEGDAAPPTALSVPGLVGQVARRHAGLPEHKYVRVDSLVMSLAVAVVVTDCISRGCAIESAVH